MNLWKPNLKYKWYGDVGGLFYNQTGLKQNLTQQNERYLPYLLSQLQGKEPLIEVLNTK